MREQSLALALEALESFGMRYAIYMIQRYTVYKSGVFAAVRQLSKVHTQELQLSLKLKPEPQAPSHLVCPSRDEWEPL